MSFRENILKKIEINRIAAQVNASLVPSGDVHKVDREGMRKLLEWAGYRRVDERDLELYVPAEAADPREIIVLDNGLAAYRTTVADVVLRKSPTVKEMISIRNVVRILKDDDVVVSKKAQTVEMVRSAGIDRLDLSFTREDLDRLRLDGAASFEGAYPEGVVETLLIFGEILDFNAPPKPFAVRHCTLLGRLSPAGADREAIYGPMVIYDRMHHTLKWIASPVGSGDREAMARFRQIVGGQAKATDEGLSVFDRLMAAAVERHTGR